MSKNKKIRKFLTPIVAIIIISILILPSSSIIAGNLQTPTDNKILSVWMNDVNGEDHSFEKNVPEEKYEQMNIFLSDVLAITNNTVDERSPGGKNITNIEWDDIGKGIIKILDFIKAVIGDDFPYETTKTYILSLINLFHGPFYLIRQPILSIGIGFTWIPFYEYETFIGRLIRPIFIRHLIGFSATAHLIPFRLGFPYWYFGLQRVRTFLFRGLLINFADLGINRIFGPQLLIGYGVFTGFVH